MNEFAAIPVFVAVVENGGYYCLVAGLDTSPLREQTTWQKPSEKEVRTFARTE